MRAILLVVLLLAAGTASAETVYVSERQFVNLRGDFVDPANVVKRLESGTALEVLERTDLLWRVRDPQGAEGWIEPRLVSAAAPARRRVAALERELAQAKAALAAERERFKGAEAALAAQREKLAAAEGRLSAAAAAPPLPPPAPAVSADPGGFRFSLAWFAIAFAMLGAGFAAGIIWVRQGIRRRMGGMYLRI